MCIRRGQVGSMAQLWASANRPSLNLSPWGKRTTVLTPQGWPGSELQPSLLLAAVPRGHLPELSTDSQVQPPCDCPFPESPGLGTCWQSAHKHLVKPDDQEAWGVEGLHGPFLQRGWAEDGEPWVWLGTHPWGLKRRLLSSQKPLTRDVSFAWSLRGQ